ACALPISDGQDYIFLDNLTLLQVSSGPPAPGAEPASPQMYNRQAEQDAAGGVTEVVLDKGMTSPVHIDMGSLRAPLSVLQDCADDLLKVWQIGRASCRERVWSTVGGGSFERKRV